MLKARSGRFRTASVVTDDDRGMDTNSTPSTPPTSTESAAGSPKAAVTSWFRHPVTIGIAAGAGALALVGATVVVVDEIAERMWPDRYYLEYVDRVSAVDDSSAASSLSTPLQQDDAPAPLAEARADDAVAAAPPAPVPAAPPAPATPVNPASQEAREFVTAVDAAVAAAGGVGVTEIAVAGRGFELDVLLPSGREVDVLVLADGSTVVDPAPYPNPTSDPALDRDRIGAILDAARAAVGTSDAAVMALSADAGSLTRYDVELATPSGTFWVELSPDLSVVEVDSDW